MPHKKKSFTLEVSDRELATILAALRYHQAENLQGKSEIADLAIREVASDSGRLRPLSFKECDRLCERINVGAEPANWEECPHDWEDSSGPETGTGAEYWFLCRLCGATKYACVEQDGSRSEEIYPPDDEPTEETAPRQPKPKSDRPAVGRPLNLARIIYDAYPDSDLLPIDPEKHCRSLDDLWRWVTTQDIGDTLFKFFVTEVVEGGEGTLEGAVRVMKRARKDAEAVLQALTRAQGGRSEGRRSAGRHNPHPAGLGIWRCHDCKRCLYRSYKKIAECGVPYCPGCGREMRLA